MSNNLAFYIITTNYHQSQNIYKIGIHTGNPYDLITRYITYFPDVIITYFQYTDKAKKVESDLKEKLSKCRITNIKGNLSEWIVIDYKKLYSIVNSKINSNENIIIDNTYVSKTFNKYVKKYVLDKNVFKASKKYNVKVNKINIKQLIAIDLSKYKIYELTKKQSENKLSETEKIVMSKHIFVENFGIINYTNENEFTEFYKKYAGKETIIKRFERIFSYGNHKQNDFENNFENSFEDNFEEDIEEDIEIENLHFLDDDNDESNNCFDDKEKERDKIIIDMLNIIIGKKKTNYKCIDYILSEQEYKFAILSVVEKSIFFSNEQKNRVLFGKSKGESRKTNEFNIKNYIGTIKTIFEDYGILFKRGSRRRINGIPVYNYYLSVNKQIKDIVDFKYGYVNNVKEFPNLFYR
ncbi:hypothetical protein qu_975 [Acanthamoeba polyphaga mimivirus]|nr:hypothetical protein [Mimivirus reunion]WMV61345.1 hypothetical protein qu_7 [Mimivirus sp.]WMV62322.1 hypothetical protein qu_7 [Acanthamoeba polyphaga mimivirus]QTF49866.1 hypothetical protein [Mimivirus reunion]WMV62309.1 hypothetical protein qu_975 [Mimivirus sp.]